MRAPGRSKSAIRSLIVFVVDLRTDRNLQNGNRPVGASHFLSHAITTVSRGNMLLKPVVDQCVEVFRSLGPNVSTAPAITAIRASELDKFLPPE